MKKQLYIFLLFILFSNLTILGQDEKAETKILVDSFIKAFNSDDYESVFSLFSDEMKKQLPLDKLNNFLQNLNSGAGKIHKNEFIKYEEKVAIYKLSFDNWTSQYSFSINKNQKIDNVFYFVPYVEEVLSGAAINRLSNSDKKISEIQTTLIFQKSKYFPNNTQISFAFINGDNVNYYGIKRQNDSILYLNNYQSIFEIGSITKLFTANLLAIIFYTNPKPFEPRERDYAVVGSFYIFAIWIGFGVLALYEAFKKYGNKKTIAVAISSLSLLAVPVLMGAQNWDDHDRSNRYTAHLNAQAYLESCDPNAIMFTIGDNDTFPLWYLQEVEGIRTDVKLINTSLFATDWYIDQMKRATYDAPPIPSQLTHDLYRFGSLDVAK